MTEFTLFLVIILYIEKFSYYFLEEISEPSLGHFLHGEHLLIFFLFYFPNLPKSSSTYYIMESEIIFGKSYCLNLWYKLQFLILLVPLSIVSDLKLQLPIGTINNIFTNMSNLSFYYVIIKGSKYKFNKFIKE